MIGPTQPKRIRICIGVRQPGSHVSNGVKRAIQNGRNADTGAPGLHFLQTPALYLESSYSLIGPFPLSQRR